MPAATAAWARLFISHGREAPNLMAGLSTSPTADGWKQLVTAASTKLSMLIGTEKWMRFSLGNISSLL